MELKPLTAASTPAWPATLLEKRTGYLISMCTVSLIMAARGSDLFCFIFLILSPCCFLSASRDRRQQRGSGAADHSSGQFSKHRVRCRRLPSPATQLAEKRPPSVRVLPHTASLCWTGAPVGQWTERFPTHLSVSCIYLFILFI